MPWPPVRPLFPPQPVDWLGALDDEEDDMGYPGEPIPEALKPPRAILTTSLPHGRTARYFVAIDPAKKDADRACAFGVIAEVPELFERTLFERAVLWLRKKFSR